MRLLAPVCNLAELLVIVQSRLANAPLVLTLFESWVICTTARPFGAHLALVGNAEAPFVCTDGDGHKSRAALWPGLIEEFNDLHSLSQFGG